jgi:putative transposase
MANTYSQLFIHIIFSVKGRQNIIRKEFKDDLYKYITGIIKEKNHKLYRINGMLDHIHIFLSLNPDESVSSLVKEIKRCSSIFINKNNWIAGHFEWQSGYGVFSYSKSQFEEVCKYIENQEQHHKIKTFREEYIEFLKKFDVPYNERYIFEEVIYI